MTDRLDETLRENGRRWAAAQTVPQLDVAMRIATRRNHRTSSLAIAASVVAIALIATVPTLRYLSANNSTPHVSSSMSTQGGSISPTASQPHQTFPARQVLRELIRRARSAATASGDPRATGDAVRTTYRDAEQVILQGSTSSNPTGKTQVWIIQLHGSFSCTDCTGLARGHTLTGTSIAVIIDARTYEGYDFVITKVPHDLASLGRIVHLPL
jgi:hypothetical protein